MGKAMFGKDAATQEKGITNYSRGVAAEECARDYLMRKGAQIIRTRYKTKFGEIDLIAKLDDVLCFIEVKSRGSQADAFESVTSRIQKGIEQSALFFLSENPEYADCGMRFDVIAVSPSFEITHLDNAWEARS